MILKVRASLIDGKLQINKKQSQSFLLLLIIIFKKIQTMKVKIKKIKIHQAGVVNKKRVLEIQIEIIIKMILKIKKIIKEVIKEISLNQEMKSYLTLKVTLMKKIN